MWEHVIVHQFDPAEQIAGGVHGFIVELVRYAPPTHTFRIVGVDGTGSRRLGVWHDVTVGGRPVRFFPVARLSAARSERRLPHSLRLASGLLSRRPTFGTAILHAHRVEIGAALSLAYPRNGLVQFVHTDSVELVRHRVESFWRLLPRTSLWLERQAVRRADRTLVMSSTAARRLAIESVTVSAGTNWFDDAIFSPPVGAEQSAPTVGWVGRLEASKSPLEAVEVFARLAGRKRDFQAWFAGSGSLERALRDRLAERGLADRVELLGTLAPEALAARLRATSILLVTSLWEGQPRAVLEALGCGVRVVSTDVGDVRDLVVEGETGFLASGRSADELAELVLAAAALPGGAGVAATVSRHRASLVVPDMLKDLVQLGDNARP